MLAADPDFSAAHPMAAEETDEDVFLMEMAFEGILPVTQFRIPSFQVWWRDRPRQPFYAFEKVLLQYLQWQDGGRQGRPWVLKAQTHLGGIQALLDVFPRATIVHCHREVTTVMASAMRTAESFRGFLAEDIDLVDLGSDIMRIYSDEITRYLAQRDEIGDRFPVVDVAYTDIVNDPIAPIREVYGLRGLDLTAEAESAMLQRADENPQYRFGRLTYSLDRYGMTKELVEDAFARYIERFSPWLR